MSEGERLLAFYRGEGTDDAGRHLADVLAFDAYELESRHDYIQWLFPLHERSRAQPDAPVLDAKSAQRFREDPALRRALARSLDVMLAFYGLRREAADPPSIVRVPDFERRARVWLTPYNHNFLRLTRILTSLCILGEQGAARALLDALTAIHREHAGTIGRETLGYWQRAVRA